MNNEQQFEFLDIITILSFILGIYNLELNQMQSNEMMKELRENQNSMLEKIIKQNEEIIKLLKEGKRYA